MPNERKASNYEVLAQIVRQLTSTNKNVMYREHDEGGVLESTINVCTRDNNHFTINMTIIADD